MANVHRKRDRKHPDKIEFDFRNDISCMEYIDGSVHYYDLNGNEINKDDELIVRNY